MSPRLLATLLFCLLAELVAGCESEEQPVSSLPSKPVTPDTLATPDTTDSIRFERYLLTGASDLLSLMAELEPEDFQTVLKLNRIDEMHAQKGDTLIIPRPVPSLRQLSPFPQLLLGFRLQPKILLVSLPVQAWGAYEHGELVRWGPTSTGKRSTPTCPGLYYTNWKSPERRSTDDQSWILRWYFNFESLGGCSIHVYGLPGHPASHSCLRMVESDAEWVYHWADQWILTPDEKWVLRNGTPLLIMGEYDFDRPPPWKGLPEDALAASVSEEDIEDAVFVYAGAEPLSSFSEEGMQIRVDVEAFSDSFQIDQLATRFLYRPDFRYFRYSLLTGHLFFLAPTELVLDFAELREGLRELGLESGDIWLEGYGLAQRVGGFASMVSHDGKVTLLLESMRVPGLSYKEPVRVGYTGTLGALSDPKDSSSPYRIILKRLRRVYGPDEVPSSSS